jgi:hypothetical protein
MSTGSAVTTRFDKEWQERAHQARHVLVPDPVGATPDGRVQMHGRSREAGLHEDRAQAQPHVPVQPGATVQLQNPQR